MPIYEYRRPDGSTFEVMQSIREDPLTHDPDTGVEVTRVLHAPAVHFKGSGFYNTDYGTRRRQRENQASGGEKGGSDGGSAEGGSAEGGSGGEKSAAKEGASAGESAKASKKPAGGDSKPAAAGSKKSAPVSA